MNKPGTKRPLCFIIQFWGERYRDYFVDYCLPSLLAPNNLPLLRAEDGHCFLIATPREDWEKIENLPIMSRLRDFATPVLIELPAPPDSRYVTALQHQTVGLKRLLEAAYERNAYGSAVWPDTIISDGFVAAMQRWVEAGYHLVMQPTVRLTEEDVLAELRTMKLLPENGHCSLTGSAITVPPRIVGALSVKHLHPEVAIMEEGHPRQPIYPPYRFWRVPHRKGIILHVFYGTPVLMDFAVVPSDHAACLDYSDIEGVYFGRNFSRCGGLYVVDDSDESGILSITPKAVNRANPRRTPRLGARWMPTSALLCNIRGAIAHYSRAQRDAVRRDMFKTSVRWHADDLDKAWVQEQSRITALIQRAAGDYYANSGAFPPRISRDPLFLPLDLLNVLQGILRFLVGGIRVAAGVLTGNPDDTEQMRQKIGALRLRLCRHYKPG